jgi:DNA-binding MarR family transcriptional regulator
LERSCDKMSLAHYRVLASVDTGEERASRLAALLALGKPAISAVLEALTRSGFLVRSAANGDEGASALSLTAECLAALSRAEMTRRLGALCARTGQSRDVQAALVALGDAVEAERQERCRDKRRGDALEAAQP